MLSPESENMSLKNIVPMLRRNELVENFDHGVREFTVRNNYGNIRQVGQEI